MKLEHIAIAVTDKSEIQHFYHDILGMNELRSFLLDKPLSRDIFGIEEVTPVVQVKKDKLLLEIFVTTEPGVQQFSHICISTKYREEMVQKATQQSYTCIRQKRPNSDLIFISDHSGNLFELVQEN